MRTTLGNIGGFRRDIGQRWKRGVSPSFLLVLLEALSMEGKYEDHVG